MIYQYVLGIAFMILTLFACDSKPKIIVEDQSNQQNEQIPGQEIAGEGVGGGVNTMDVHQVVAKEILQAERYTYLQVIEKQKTFWIATAKTEAEKGKVYLYRGGLLKTNFKSQEFDQTFDTIYLVSHIIDAAAHPGGDLTKAPQSGSTIGAKPINTPPANIKDAVKLSDLFANKAKYDGQIITITGECMKVNNGIMGKNWLHIQDGSKAKGKNLDLTVTTSLNIPVGSKVALQGKIVLNKDFGAGYRYDIMMEEAQMR